MNQAPALSLADLEAFDPRAASTCGAGERRFCCPLCGHDKGRDAAHRCLCLNSESGLWTCNRCKATGKLRDFWRAPDTRRARATVPGSLRSGLFSGADRTVRTTPTVRPIGDSAPKWCAAWAATLPLEGTPGAKYLQGRGIPVEVAAASGVRFSRFWQGEAAAVFPLRDREGTVIAAQGRHVQGDGKRTGGPRRLGAFFAPWLAASGRAFGPLDAQAPAVIVCEAPIDALSIATAGFPALALCGCDAPEWLHRACAFKRVLLATDADEAGDAAAQVLDGLLSSYGARCARLRPENGKDWNAVLQVLGAAALAAWLTERVLIDLL